MIECWNQYLLLFSLFYYLLFFLYAISSVEISNQNVYNHYQLLANVFWMKWIGCGSTILSWVFQLLFFLLGITQSFPYVQVCTCVPRQSHGTTYLGTFKIITHLLVSVFASAPGDIWSSTLATVGCRSNHSHSCIWDHTGLSAARASWMQTSCTCKTFGDLDHTTLSDILLIAALM